MPEFEDQALDGEALGEGESERSEPERCDTAFSGSASGNREAPAAPSPSATCPECGGSGVRFSSGAEGEVPCDHPSCKGSGKLRDPFACPRCQAPQNWDAELSRVKEERDDYREQRIEALRERQDALDELSRVVAAVREHRENTERSGRYSEYSEELKKHKAHNRKLYKAVLGDG